MSTPICAVDTETTGLGPDCLAWEVALIRRETCGNENAISFFVEVDLSDADPFALKVGGFHERHPLGRYLAGYGVEMPEPYDEGAEYLTEPEAARLVARYTHGATLVGSNPSFDADVLARLLRSVGLLPGWSHRLRDVATLTSGHLRRDVGGLDGALDALGIDLHPKESRHTASGDALAALDVYDAVLGGEQQ